MKEIFQKLYKNIKNVTYKFALPVALSWYCLVGNPQGLPFYNIKNAYAEIKHIKIKDEIRLSEKEYICSSDKVYDHNNGTILYTRFECLNSEDNDDARTILMFIINKDKVKKEIDEYLEHVGDKTYNSTADEIMLPSKWTYFPSTPGYAFDLLQGEEYPDIIRQGERDRVFARQLAENTIFTFEVVYYPYSNKLDFILGFLSSEMWKLIPKSNPRIDYIKRREKIPVSLCVSSPCLEDENSVIEGRILVDPFVNNMEFIEEIKKHVPYFMCIDIGYLSPYLEDQPKEIIEKARDIVEKSLVVVIPQYYYRFVCSDTDKKDNFYFDVEISRDYYTYTDTSKFYVVVKLEEGSTIKEIVKKARRTFTYENVKTGAEITKYFFKILWDTIKESVTTKSNENKDENSSQ